MSLPDFYLLVPLYTRILPFSTISPFSFQDSRYNDEVDQITGYKTVSLLCMPIRNADDEIVAVAQVINKTNEKGFTKDDEKVGKPLSALRKLVHAIYRAFSDVNID